MCVFDWLRGEVQIAGLICRRRFLSLSEIKTYGLILSSLLLHGPLRVRNNLNYLLKDAKLPYRQKGKAMYFIYTLEPAERHIQTFVDIDKKGFL